MLSLIPLLTSTSAISDTHAHTDNQSIVSRLKTRREQVMVVSRGLFSRSLQCGGKPQIEHQSLINLILFLFKLAHYLHLRRTFTGYRRLAILDGGLPSLNCGTHLRACQKTIVMRCNSCMTSKRFGNDPDAKERPNDHVDPSPDFRNRAGTSSLANLVRNLHSRRIGPLPGLDFAFGILAYAPIGVRNLK